MAPEAGVSPGDLPSPGFVRRFAHVLPVSQLRRATAAALALPDVALRSEFVRALCDRLARVPHPLEAETAFVADAGELEDARAFGAVLDAVRESTGEDVSRLVAPVRLVRFAPELGRWLAPLFPDTYTVPGVAFDRIAPLVSRVQEERLRARALALVAPVLWVDHASVEAAHAIDDEWLRAAVLSLLAIRMPGSVLGHAFDVARSIGHPAARASAMASLASWLGYAMWALRDLVGSEVEHATTISEPHMRARAITAFAPVTRGFFPELAAAAARVASALPEGRPRATTLEALRLPWPQPYVPFAGGDWDTASDVWRLERLSGLERTSQPAAFDEIFRDLVVAIGTETSDTPPMDPGGGALEAEPRVDAEPARRGFAPPRRRAERYVNLGFALPHRPAEPRPDTSTLGAYYDYLFWLDVGKRDEASIVGTPTEVLPGEDPPAGAKLDVVLFGFPGGLELVGATSAEMVVRADGTVDVLRQPGDGPGREYYDLRKRRLFFRVRAPASPGTARMRCNIYYEQNLIQSYLVLAEVTRVPRTGGIKALHADPDFTLAPTLDAAHLRGLARHRLSVMLNRNEDGTHAFMFVGRAPSGGEEFRQLATLTGTELKNLIDIGRGALRRTAWGTTEPYIEGTDVYRYDGPPSSARLTQDLFSLARAGYRVYVRISKELAGGRQRARELMDLMRTSGFVQIALKERAEHILPAALLYDYPLDTNADLSLCPEFEAALGAGIPLENTECFANGCRHADPRVMCPSGFWGYRHALGLPVSTRYAPAVPTVLDAGDGLDFVAAVCTDPQFVRRTTHLDAIRRECSPKHWQIADTRDAALSTLKQAKPHLVYFYCHGGVTASRVPFLIVGPLKPNDGISPDNFNAYQITWPAPRPIIFLNGCNTTALEPVSAISFVTTFVEDCFAAGVVGTEITVFEPLACRFAEECLLRFFRDRLPFGEAVRRARIALLAESNPLGLVYIPYVQTGLALA